MMGANCRTALKNPTMKHLGKPDKEVRASGYRLHSKGPGTFEQLMQARNAAKSLGHKSAGKAHNSIGCPVQCDVRITCPHLQLH
jgi:hypothetical protein